MAIIRSPTIQCDNCGRKEEFPDDGYPLGWFQLREAAPSDTKEYGDFCSLPCTATWAQNEQAKRGNVRTQN